ncbi:ATP-binding cassette sub-family A member 5 isoform X2 [Lingula anatina]|nr:ATP-binding cassette sub-family A member 5 isoform X2 [Lingula anatina]XP_013402814.1 ATP-binding cassette sub-family A member 5 isoform X2 [Lingula anatina]XP_013402816.1 ATP-binding cassette sub-family A member 5 isoform X2 [Lingula anatina]|eukprot:XP_013402813.1 ATP-binding cassette sub-family A member 5 isoform X2 [Lingula anatina]
MAGATFWQQLKALLHRNFLLKLRVKGLTIQEIFFPVYFVLLLVLVKRLSTPESNPSIPEFPEYDFNTTLVPNRNKTLLISPNSTEVSDIIGTAAASLGLQYMMFEDVMAMENFYKANASVVFAGVHFSSNSTYTIRTSYEHIASTKDIYDVSGGSTCRSTTGGLGLTSVNCPANSYLHTGFVLLQHAIDMAIVKNEAAGQPFIKPDLMFQMMPKMKFTPNSDYIRILSGIFFVMAYSPFVSGLVVYLITEKEKKTKEAMRMMGMKDSAFWLAWLLMYTGFILIVTVIVVLLAMAGQFFDVNKSNLFIFFLMLFMYGLTVINMSFILQGFFSRALVGGIASSFFTTLISLLYLVISTTRTYDENFLPKSTIPIAGQYALCLMSPVAVALSVDMGLFLDITGRGMTFDTLHVGQFPISSSLIMLAVDFVLYGLLAAYLDNVIPTEYGNHRSPFFCFLSSYWCPEKKHKEMVNVTDGINTIEAEREPVPQSYHGREGLRLFGIKKIFKGKENVTAVDGLTLDMYEGEITAVLGHNGAGKTTLINMLTGLTPTTSGSAYILGLDVTDVNDMDQIREMTGVCPQHDILFDKLSCREHLEFFGNLKGVPKDRLDNEITKALQEVDLEDQEKTFSEELSGGQKRKLSVAIALIGDPKFIFLDEPTAGMDPYSRRHLWTLLKQRQAGKVILLTTHFMDEADILADRKAIISKGRLKCYGSSLFLKNRFGIGYHLQMVVQPDTDAMQVNSLVSTYVPDAKVGRTHGRELAYTLPLESVNKFPDLFAALENPHEGSSISMGDALGITSYGVSMTTLEEVFLKLGEEEEELKAIDEYTKSSSNNQVAPVDDDDESKLTREEALSLVGNHGSLTVSLKQQIKALCMVGVLKKIRNKLAIIFQLFLPITFIVIGLVLSKYVSVNPDLTPKPLSVSDAKYIYTKNNINRNAPLMYYIDENGFATTDIILNVCLLQAQGLQFEKINSSTNLIDARPHNMGIRINQWVNQSVSGMRNFTVIYNDTAIHSLPALIGTIDSMVLKMTRFPANVNATINTTNLPWPSINPTIVFDSGAFSAIILIGMGMVMVAPGFAGELVKERQFKSRSQLRISGITLNIYWGSMFLVDIVQFAVVPVLSIIIILAFQVESLLVPGAIVSLIILYLLFMPINIMYSYVWSFAFTKYENAMAFMPNVFIFTSLLPYMAVAILDGSNQEDAAGIVHLICTAVSPPYFIMGGLHYIEKIHRTHVLLAEAGDVPFSYYFDWNKYVLPSWLLPIAHLFILFILLRVLDVKSTGGSVVEAIKCGGKEGPIVANVPEENDDVIRGENSDVLEERDRVENWRISDSRKVPVVMVKNLRKEFLRRDKKAAKKKGKKEERKRVAVRNASFAVEAGEVFGLLGPNGAGKTTTLNMIIAETCPTKGKVTVAGTDIKSSISDAFRAMGYCPQHDALWDYITPREHLECYAACRGIPDKDIKYIAERYLQALNIEEHANKQARQLSGGTKRKLSFAMCMLGESKAVLLDEPSTGMDPKSKRFLWDVISNRFQGDRRGAILTTHYMEEADALCSRLAIMVNGEVKCLGTTQHLKHTYGSGYVLEVKLKTEDGDTMEVMDEKREALKDFVINMFPTAEEAESFGERTVYKIPQTGVVSLSKTFSKLEEAKGSLGIEEYSFSQSTLEQVFLSFAKQQRDDNVSPEEEERERRRSISRRNSRTRSISSSHRSPPTSPVGTPLEGYINQSIVDNPTDFSTKM